MWSASTPCSSGITAPPTIAITSRLDTLPVSAPNFSIPSVKMLGNITELNRPIAITLHIATEPVQHRRQHQRAGDRRERGEQLARVHARQQRRTDEAPDHRAAPVPRHEAGRVRLTHAAELRQRQTIDREAADRNFRTDVDASRHHRKPYSAVVRRAV